MVRINDLIILLGARILDMEIKHRIVGSDHKSYLQGVFLSFFKYIIQRYRSIIARLNCFGLYNKYRVVKNEVLFPDITVGAEMYPAVCTL